MSALAMVLALALDGALGWPDALFARIGHPVTWIGRLIAALDRRWNNDNAAPHSRRIAGALTTLLVVGLTVALAALVQHALPDGWIGLLLTAILAAPLLAARSLWDHVAAVAAPLAQDDLAGAREQVARIVGRNPEMLDAGGVARAAIESLAENSSDGVTAPLFWGVLFGLPGIAGYKAINTLDSMIGYRTPRHEDFGKAAARLDDVVNWIPARLTALGFALACGAPGRVWPVIRADAGHHRSPNAGWPEAAMAAAIDVRLSGPRAYAGRMEHHAWVNGAAPDPDAAAIRAALALYRRMLALLAGAALLLALV